jgi:prepilin-type N-terminal cleavage/methylation domain-containing protein
VLRRKSGFTLIELVVVMSISILVALTFYTFFKTNLFTYLNLQNDATSFSALATQSQRIASVVRGTTGIVSAAPNDLVAYAYFYPSDSYVSLIHYYENSTDTILYADVTPMSSNPPIGTPITASEKTFTIIPDFYQPTNGSLFTYLDASNSALPTPISDLNSIKAVQVNLAAKGSDGHDQTVTVYVNLRNRDTNI